MDLLSLVAKLSLDPSEYENGLNAAAGKAGSFGSALKSGLGAAAKVGAAAIGAATAAVGAFAKSSISAGQSFDTSMSQVAATMGLTMDQMQNEVGEVDLAWGHFSGNLREYALEMGANTAFSATQAADALNYMALAGYDTQASMEMLPNVLNLAAAGSMDLATASDMITDASSALGLSLEDTSLMVDQMAKASSKSNTSVSQLGEAMLTIGATARNLAGGTTELSAVLGVLADNGIKGAEGGTHLRNAILSLQTPTKDGTEALAELGMTYSDMYDEAGNMRALPEIFMQISDAMEGMSQQSKDAIISGIFNKADLAAINALVGTNAERWSELQLAIESAWYTSESLNGELSKWGLNLDTLQENLSTLGVSQEQFNDALGKSNGSADDFADILLDMADKGTTFEDIVTALGGSMDNLDEAFTATTGAAQQMADVQLDNLAGDVTLFKSALEYAQIAISDALTPALRDFVQLGTRGLTDLKDALSSGDFGGIINVFSQVISDGLQMIFKMLPQAIEMGGEIVISLTQGIITNLPTLLTGLGDVLMALGESLQEHAPELLTAGADLLNFLIEGFVEGIPLFAQTMSSLMAEFGTFIQNSLPALMESGMEIMGQIASAIINAIPVLASAAVSLMSNLGSYLRENLPTIIETGLQIISQLAESLHANAGMMVDGALGLALSLAQGLIDSIPAIVENVPEIVSNIANIINDNAPKVLEAGVQLIIMLVQGLINSIPVIVANLPQIIMAIWNTITAFQWVNLGKHVVQFFTNGITNSLSQVVQSAKDIIKSISENGGLKNLPQMALQWGKDLIDNFISGITSKLGSLKDTVLGAANMVKDFLGFSEPKEGPLSNFHTYAPDMMELFAQGIRDNERLVTDQLEKSFDFAPTISDAYGSASQEYAGTGTGTAYDPDDMNEVIALLTQIVNGGIKVQITGSTATLYSAIRKDNQKFTRAKGVNGFA